MTLTLQHAGATDPGRTRDHNEDNWTADPDQGLFIVSDGIGGHFAGAEAAEMVVTRLPGLVCQALSGVDDLSDRQAERLLKSALRRLSCEMYDQADGIPGRDGMGATVVAAVIRGGKALIAHMGDSRAYLIREGRIRQLTKDHSIVQLLIDNDEISRDAASTHPSKGQITRSVGMDGDPLPDARLIELRPDDRIILCTDGLTEMVDDEQIRHVVASHPDPAAACRLLIDTANELGGDDNVTVVIVHVVQE